MKGNNGSELHRLTELKPYDEDLFNRLYKTCKPLIRRLVRGIDSRRFNVTPDIINSFFWDKFLYVFNKYQSEYDEERLKATLLSSLQTFKSKLLRNAYTKQAEFNQRKISPIRLPKVLIRNCKQIFHFHFSPSFFRPILSFSSPHLDGLVPYFSVGIPFLCSRIQTVSLIRL